MASPHSKSAADIPAEDYRAHLIATLIVSAYQDAVVSLVYPALKALIDEQDAPDAPSASWKHKRLTALNEWKHVTSPLSSAEEAWKNLATAFCPTEDTMPGLPFPVRQSITLDEFCSQIYLVGRSLPEGAKRPKAKAPLFSSGSSFAVILAGVPALADLCTSADEASRRAYVVGQLSRISDRLRVHNVPFHGPGGSKVCFNSWVNITGSFDKPRAPVQDIFERNLDKCWAERQMEETRAGWTIEATNVHAIGQYLKRTVLPEDFNLDLIRFSDEDPPFVRQTYQWAMEQFASRIQEPLHQLILI